MDRFRLPKGTGARFAMLASFWMLVGLTGGSAIWMSARVDGIPLDWMQATRPAMLAALLWIPITLAAQRLARRFPVRGERRTGHGLLHLVSALAASFVLNFMFFAIESSLRVDAIGFSTWVAAASAAGLRFLHVNALVYLVIVGVVHVRDRPGGTPQEAEPEEGWVRSLEARSGGRITLLDVDEIEWIEADGDYARVHLADAEHLVSERMKHLEDRLDPARFVRIHRSRIVNVHHVRELRHLSHGDYEVTLADDTRLRVSRGRRPRLIAAVEEARGSRG